VFIAALIVSLVLAALLVFSAVGKLTKNAMQMATMSLVGFPADRVWMLATLELLAAAGLVAGLFWWPIGVAAAIGAVLYFVGATVGHLRVKDYHLQGPLPMLVLSVAALVLRILSI
jgi:uncharacterized membrane protein YphA (DoxX/SURF4 family)